MAIDVNVPNIGNAEDVEVTEIMVRVGEKVEKDQAIITVESDKAAIEIPSPTSGIVKEIKIKIGDKIRTGSPMMVLDIEETKIAEKKEDEGPNLTPPITKTTDTSNDVVHATPLIRQMAREFGVHLTSVIGTGRKGRILREDIQSYIKNRMQSSEETTLPPPTAATKEDSRKFGETEEVELSRVQKISSANLHRNWVMIPHVTQFDETDITDMEVFRKNHNSEAEKNNRDIKITPLSFIMKAVSKALEAYPRFNSALSEDGKKLILKKYVHIGVAVDTPKGLVVPVCYDVNKKGIIELSRNLKEMANKARSAKLAPADMQGGCFTISNIGSMGGTSFFTPIINAPEVAILGVSKSSMKLVWNGEAFVPRCLLPLSLSYDHRVIDGADSARFIRFLNTLLSDIRHLLM